MSHIPRASSEHITREDTFKRDRQTDNDIQAKLFLEWRQRNEDLSFKKKSLTEVSEKSDRKTAFKILGSLDRCNILAFQCKTSWADKAASDQCCRDLFHLINYIKIMSIFICCHISKINLHSVIVI